MFYYNQYVRAQSLDEAYELYQKKPNFVLGGMLWLKMKNKTLGTAECIYTRCNRRVGQTYRRSAV